MPHVCSPSKKLFGNYPDGGFEYIAQKSRVENEQRGARISLCKLQRVRHPLGTSRGREGDRSFFPCGLTHPSVHEFLKLLLKYGADEIRFLSGFDGPRVQETDYLAIIWADVDAVARG